MRPFFLALGIGSRLEVRDERELPPRHRRGADIQRGEVDRGMRTECFGLTP